MKVVKSFGLQGKKGIIQLLILIEHFLQGNVLLTKVPNKNISFPEKGQEISSDSLL